MLKVIWNSQLQRKFQGVFKRRAGIVVLTIICDNKAGWGGGELLKLDVASYVAEHKINRHDFVTNTGTMSYNSGYPEPGTLKTIHLI